MFRSLILLQLRIIGAGFLTFLLTAAGLLLASSPAHADGASLAADPTTELAPAGTEVTVKGSGYQPNIGLFVVVCDPSVPKGGACDMANFKQATTDADGAFEVKLKAVAVFGQTDCARVTCGVQSSKVGDGGDRSQERTVPIGFAGGVAPADGWPNVGTADADPGQADTASDAAAEPKKQTSSEADSGSSTPIVAGIVAAIAVIGAALVFLRRRQKTDIQ